MQKPKQKSLNILFTEKISTKRKKYIRLGRILDTQNRIIIYVYFRIDRIRKMDGNVGGPSPFALSSFKFNFFWFVSNFENESSYDKCFRLLVIAEGHSSFVSKAILFLFNIKLLLYKANVLTKFASPQLPRSFLHKVFIM